MRPSPLLLLPDTVTLSHVGVCDPRRGLDDAGTCPRRYSFLLGVNRTQHGDGDQDGTC